MGNIHVKLYVIWTSGSEGDVIYRKSLKMMEDGRRTTDAQQTMDES